MTRFKIKFTIQSQQVPNLKVDYPLSRINLSNRVLLGSIYLLQFDGSKKSGNKGLH